MVEASRSLRGAIVLGQEGLDPTTQRDRRMPILLGKVTKTCETHGFANAFRLVGACCILRNNSKQR